MKFLITMRDAVKYGYIFIIILFFIFSLFILYMGFNEPELKYWYESERVPFSAIRQLMSFELFRISMFLFAGFCVFVSICLMAILKRRYVEIMSDYLIIRFGISNKYRKIYNRNLPRSNHF